jgi:hypothetical protein
MGLSAGKYHIDVDAIAANETDIFTREYIRMNTKKHPTVYTTYVIMHFEIRNGRIARANDFPVDTYDWEQFYAP